MPQTQPIALKDFFANIASSFDPKNIKTPNNFGTRTQTLPNDTGSFQSPTVNNGQVPFASAAPIPPKTTAPVTAPAGRVFSGGSPATAPTQTNTSAPYQLDSKYINPTTGKPFTPQEYADTIAQKVSGGSVSAYARSAIDNPDKSQADLETNGRKLNNERNDIATGETDPYKNASQSGIQYTPSELAAIEKATAGIYDPAINDVFTKLKEKKTSDEKIAATQAAKEKSDTDFQNELKKLAVQHGYDVDLKKIEAAASDPSNPKVQDKLEQEYRNILIKPLSNRSGGLGLEDSKVNQAIHLAALVKQYKDANGNYNIPATQYNELALGLARLLSPSGTVGSEVQQSITQSTAKGDIGKALTYITGTPVSGSTQNVFKNLIDTIDRQGQIASQNRDTYMQYLQGLVPTDLDVERSNALESKLLNQYQPITGGNDNGTAGGVSVTDPDGGVHTFTSQSDADAFKKAAGIK